MSHLILWTYEVAPEVESAFRAAYSVDGEWARLFARAPGFLGVELFSDGSRYLTVDRWETREAFETFKTGFAQAYAELDSKLAPLTLSETKLGAFDSV
jgi:heme-degrading monooxygenase HmoA